MSKSLPVTKADIKVSKKHLKATIKLDKQKIADHEKLTKNGGDPTYNRSHAQGHKKDVKAELKQLKKVNKLRGR